MVEKVAESRALRRAFPTDLSGIYSDEEMEQATTTDSTKIESEMVDKIDSAINGYDDIRAGLLRICGVKQISDIKQSQLEACRQFVKVQIENKKNMEIEGETNHASN